MIIKMKISKNKRNNQKKNKLIKQGVIRKSKLKKHAQQTKTPVNKIQVQNENPEISDDSDQGADMLEMVEDEDINFLKNAITNKSYSILNKIRNSEIAVMKSKKRKLVHDNETLEEEYAEKISEETENKRVKGLLPIKTKTGVIPQTVLESVEELDEDTLETHQDDEYKSDAGGSSHEDLGIDTANPVSTAHLLAARNEALRQKKIHIGTLSSGLLENPEEKVTNLKSLLDMLDGETPGIYFTVKKLIIVSLLEVFKDILPSYEIRSVKQEGVKLKKDTLKLQKYEETLLLYYKKYLQKLEKCSFLIVKKKGDTRKLTEDKIKLSIIAIRALCDLLVTHPYFNFSQNIVQALVPFLNNFNKEVRIIVKDAIVTLFREDKKEEITLKILRIINNYLKNHTHGAHTEMFEVLLVLKLKDVNLDQEKEVGMKQKKLKAHKSRILQLSKKERKRKKKLQEVEKELLETKAEENVQTKLKNLTEITKIIFNIYFRILKNSVNPKVLGICLEGLAKFAHCINLEFYMDIVNVLDKLLNEEWLGYKEQLNCIQTVFAILGGQGETLNLDPTRFYNRLYNHLLTLTIASKRSECVIDLIKTLSNALIKRRKKITNKRTLGFVKRLATLSLQLSHDGSLGCLGIIRNIIQLNSQVDILLDFDTSVGEGKFQAEIEDPEYCNAGSTALYELSLLTRHYHPVVSKYAKNISHGIPTSGEGSLSGEHSKYNPEQLYEEFNMSEMAFNPPVPIPKVVQPKSKQPLHRFFHDQFYEECRNLINNNRDTDKRFWINDISSTFSIK